MQAHETLTVQAAPHDFKFGRCRLFRFVLFRATVTVGVTHSDLLHAIKFLFLLGPFLLLLFLLVFARACRVAVACSAAEHLLSNVPTGVAGPVGGRT